VAVEREGSGNYGQDWQMRAWLREEKRTQADCSSMMMPQRNHQHNNNSSINYDNRTTMIG
jgi:hypothetical protein